MKNVIFLALGFLTTVSGVSAFGTEINPASPKTIYICDALGERIPYLTIVEILKIDELTGKAITSLAVSVAYPAPGGTRFQTLTKTKQATEFAVYSSQDYVVRMGFIRGPFVSISRKTKSEVSANCHKVSSTNKK